MGALQRVCPLVCAVQRGSPLVCAVPLGACFAEHVVSRWACTGCPLYAWAYASVCCTWVSLGIRLLSAVRVYFAPTLRRSLWAYSGCLLCAWAYVPWTYVHDAPGPLRSMRLL